MICFAFRYLNMTETSRSARLNNCDGLQRNTAKSRPYHCISISIRGCYAELRPLRHVRVCCQLWGVLVRWGKNAVSYNRLVSCMCIVGLVYSPRGVSRVVWGDAPASSTIRHRYTEDVINKSRIIRTPGLGDLHMLLPVSRQLKRFS